MLTLSSVVGWQNLSWRTPSLDADVGAREGTSRIQGEHMMYCKKEPSYAVLNQPTGDGEWEGSGYQKIMGKGRVADRGT